MHAFFESGMVWKIFNFAVLVGVLVYFLRKPSKQFWGDRSRFIASETEEAARQVLVAEGRLQELQKRLGQMDSETKRLIEELKREGQAQREKIQEETFAWQNRMTEGAKKVAEQEIQKAFRSLQKEMAEEVTRIVTETLRQKIQETDRARLTEGAMGRLEGGLA